MKLLGDHIAVKMDDTQGVAAGSLVPQNEDQSRTGAVIIVGPGDLYEGVRQPMAVEVGNRVLLDSYAGLELNYKGDKVKIVDEHSVMAILEEGDEE